MRRTSLAGLNHIHAAAKKPQIQPQKENSSESFRLMRETPGGDAGIGYGGGTLPTRR
jgi:hypothetical protein